MGAAEKLDRDALRRMVEAALPVAETRGHLLGEIKDALLRGDEPAAVALMRRYCGIPPVQIQP